MIMIEKDPNTTYQPQKSLLPFFMPDKYLFKLSPVYKTVQGLEGSMFSGSRLRVFPGNCMVWRHNFINWAVSIRWPSIPELLTSEPWTSETWTSESQNTAPYITLIKTCNDHLVNFGFWGARGRSGRLDQGKPPKKVKRQMMDALVKFPVTGKRFRWQG